MESYGELALLERQGMAQGRKLASSGTYEEMGSYYSPLY